ncbi:MAG: hypothetical protein JWO32_1755, partial [Bacteroidetes bacterium]|nr:hypothetical protein [Bacteroidota bacterium]
MMKKFLYTITSALIFSAAVNAQEPATAKDKEFDKKFRFGLRVT